MRLKVKTRQTGNFYLDVIRKSPRFGSVERVASTGMLHPVLRRKVGAIIADLARHGIKACIYETYRSQARQEECYRTGASELRTVGLHHFGLACDIVFLDHHGEPTWEGDYSLLGKIATAHHLIWGGDWGHPWRKTTFPDQPHVQWCNEGDQHAVLSGQGYPTDEYDPYAHRSMMR